MRFGALMPVFAPSRLLTGRTPVAVGQTIIDERRHGAR
jgi:hypothetical protein